MQEEMHFAFDFYPLQTEEHTRIARFFQGLKEGRLTTTKCRTCGELLWQPRIVCPKCNGNEMEWVDLPNEGTVFAFTTVYHGAPLGMEKDVPFVVAVIDLDGVPLKLVGRIDDARQDALSIGDRVTLKVVDVGRDRVWFRFVPA